MHFLNLSVLPEVYLGKDLLACGQHQNMECKDSLLKFKRALYGWSDMHHSTPPILFNMDKL